MSVIIPTIVCTILIGLFLIPVLYHDFFPDKSGDNNND